MKKEIINNLYVIVALSIVAISFNSCTNNNKNSFKFDTSKNIYKEEEKNIKDIVINESKDAVLLNSIGSIDSIVVLDTVAIIGKIDKIQVMFRSPK